MRICQSELELTWISRAFVRIRCFLVSAGFLVRFETTKFCSYCHLVAQYQQSPIPSVVVFCVVSRHNAENNSSVLSDTILLLSS